jgi:peptidoglycan-associated lipoprotein
MKTRLFCMVAAVALVAACSDDSAKKGGDMSMAAPSKPVQTASIVPGSAADFQQNVGDKVFFDYDKSSLTPEAKTQLSKWVAFLKQYPSDQLTVEGHCDERGTKEYNLALGEKRANSIKEFLVSQGVQTSRLKTVSYGKERPLVAESNESAWAKNRRGVGVIN